MESRADFRISIHALLAESDPNAQNAFRLNQYFYPRSPCGERLAQQRQGYLPVGYFYPRSPCGERRYLINTYHRIFGISIHALLAESDLLSPWVFLTISRFLSTLSLRRATKPCTRLSGRDTISIHALLAESDCFARCRFWA